jgi:hypothetical protein
LVKLSNELVNGWLNSQPKVKCINWFKLSNELANCRSNCDSL